MIMGSAARALVVVPPFLKYTSGPLLGPALLQSAATMRGHDCRVLDLNAHYIRHEQHLAGVSVTTPAAAPPPPKFVGDHNKPSLQLQQLEQDFVARNILPGLLHSPTVNGNPVDWCRKIRFGFLTHKQVESAARAMTSSSSSSSPFGVWASEILRQAHPEPPHVVGLSLLHAGQVIPAVAISMLARTLWPNTCIVWGGPHMSGLGRAALEREDLSHRDFAADVFVTGHAEQTFVNLLDAFAAMTHGDSVHGEFLSRPGRPLVLEGTRGGSVPPVFENLDLYQDPLTLPAQSTLGCSYGRCAYCTYPAVEPTPSRLELQTSVGVVAELAEELGASLSVKDSLATPLRLRQLGDCIANRARWSASTKLSSRLDTELLTRLEKSGLATLEVGLESLLEETQHRIGKVQSQALYEEFVASVAEVPNLTLIINYMVGFPWEEREAALVKLSEAQSILNQKMGSERAKIELNDFELERMSPMARHPELFEIGQVTSWPWASVLEFKPTPPREE